MVQQMEKTKVAYRRLTETEIKQASKVSMVGYLEKKGETFRRVGKNYFHEEHDSLVICPEKGYFSWNSKGISDQSCIILAMEFYGYSFSQATQDILEQNVTEQEVLQQAQKETKKKPFCYETDIKEANNQTKIVKYLVHERKINPWLLSELIQKKYIAQDERGNVVYKWFDPLKKTEVVGAAKEGVTIIPEEKRIAPGMKRFKQVMTTGNNGFYFDVGKTSQIDKLFIFESPVDMMSYLTLKMLRGDQSIINARFLAMDGVKPATFFHHHSLLTSKLKRPIKPIICSDNDAAGHILFDAIEMFDFSDEEGNDLLKNEIPYDLAISREMGRLYKEVADEYQVDWKWIAAIHKCETNGTPRGRVANSSEIQQFFHTPKKGTPEMETYSVVKEVMDCARKLKSQPQGDIKTFELYKEVVDDESNKFKNKYGFFERVDYYYQKYNNGEHYYVENVPKDWNEILVAIQEGDKEVYTLLPEEQVMNRTNEPTYEEVGMQHA